ncbi:MAG: hypothetical protein N2Z21_06030 [Candidatus Sumerlaeaceae bacterium]|nr:hypothetical protein [Candidatus Sumerlaeaceae bacterium]
MIAFLGVLVSACSIFRPPFDAQRKLTRDTLSLPPSVRQTLARKGFVPLPPGEGQAPTRCYWCVRPVNIPGGRIASAVGWYHEWILAPSIEKGADFRGADSVRGTWPPSPTAFFFPLQVSDHKGAALGPETYCRIVPDVSPASVRRAVADTPRAGFLPFPVHNCDTWVRKVIKKARGYERISAGQ